jgi:hypothetical protein
MPEVLLMGKPGRTRTVILGNRPTTFVGGVLLSVRDDLAKACLRVNKREGYEVFQVTGLTPPVSPPPDPIPESVVSKKKPKKDRKKKRMADFSQVGLG